ncbi:MAG: hypothetical protein ACQER9_04030 [Nanobdellota archaeon]
MKEFAKQILADVSKSEEFVLHHGGFVRTIKNLIDLKIELQNMSEEEFRHHVNSKRNDFAKWIKDSVKDDKLAEDLNVAETKDDMLEIISQRIDFAVSVIEKENKNTIDDEVKHLRAVENNLKKSKNKKDISKIDEHIKSIKKDMGILSKNSGLESKSLKKENNDDLRFLSWEEMQKVPANAKVIEFLFGFVVGLMLGMLLAKVILGM